MKKILFLLFLFTLIFPQPLWALVYPDPQYILVNKCPTCSSGSNYLYFYGQNQNIGKGMVDEVRNTIGTDGTANRRLGLSFIVQYFHNSRSENQETIQKILALSKNYNIPVLIKLDDTFWDNHPDLWNWWNPNLAGYDPNNKYNVEWTGWSPDTATKISWLNWGGQVRLAPRPNLGSPKVIQAKQEELRNLLPPIVSWYNALSADKKYLLAGVVLDNELSIGINGYFYPNGNSYLENYPNEPGRDPTYGLNPNSSLPLAQQGYAAATSYGIKTSGSLNQADLNQIVHHHAEMLEKTALDTGLPFDKIFVHGGGNFTGNYNWTFTSFSYDDIITNFGKPGWSFYDKAYNPASAPGLSSALDNLDNTPWAAVEWLYSGGNSGSGKEQWVQALNNTLNYRNNKFLDIYNWEGISDNPDALSAIHDVLNTSLSCWLSTPIISAKASGNSVTLSWEKPINALALYLNISNNPNRRPSGSIQDINILNETVTNNISRTITLSVGTYYWQIVAEGCNPVQRRIAYAYFTIPASLPADLNSDGKVDIFDYNILVQNFGQTGSPGWISSDINKDGKVDIFDFNLLVQNFGK